MSSLVSDALEIDAVRYLGTLALGFLLGLGTELIIEIRTETRRRRVAREMLAVELSRNLFSLDEIDASLSKAVTLEPSSLVLTKERLQNKVLATCLDPEITSVLTEMESIQIASAYSQTSDLNDALANLRSSWMEGRIDRTPN